MLTEKELEILALISQRMLVRPSEMRREFGASWGDGINSAIQKMILNDLVDVIEPIGERCLVITQKGKKFLREAKNPQGAASGSLQMFK